LESAYHDPKNAIMVHYPRFTLPPNNESLDYVSGKEKTFGRYSYLLEHRKELAAQTAHDSFHAVVIRQLSTSTDYLSRLKNFHLVEFETGCDMLCSAHSLRVCREFNTSICAAHLSSYAHEIPTLDSLLRIQRLGRPIIIWERQ
jgi:hypothetical protein